MSDIIEELDPRQLTAQVLVPGMGVIEVDGSTVIEVADPSVTVIEVTTPDLIGPSGPQGVAGPIGVIGPAGPTGPVGPFAPLFIQTFNVPSAVWVIHHNLMTYPVVTTVDLNGDEVIGDVTAPDINTVVVTFVMPMAGTARLKA